MNRTGARITDSEGRTLILRGVNLGGSSKIPVNSPSFVGRPFPQEEADQHFERLKNWGFTFIRLVITWEALEHSGPGEYDESYLAYLRQILLAAEKRGISVYMDPHQDVWSRFTGGDGAPAWTLEKLGMDTDKIDAAGAAVTPNQRFPNREVPNLQFPNQKFDQGKKMIWPVNYSLYAAATMFTLFFGGNAFAPELKIEGESVQDFLVERYLAAFRHCYRRLKNCKAIVGWGAMNEPHPGFIGYRDLRRLENVTLALGPVPSAFQSMIAASGRPVEVPVYTPWLKGQRITGKQTINPEGIPLFKDGFTCPWKQAGIWADEPSGPKLLKPEHFSTYQGRPVRFADDFLKPFMIRFIEKMQEADRPALFFIEGVPHGENPTWGKDDPQNTVNAFHHYDTLTLFTKSFRPWLTINRKTGGIILGRKKTSAHYSARLAEAKTWTRESMGDMPCLLGEFGLPFDLQNKKAYKTGDYSLHEKALSLYYDGIDENLLSSTIWNYTAGNNHEDGDFWNGEDFSIVTSGGTTTEGSLAPRGMGGWLRPYPMATAGIPLQFRWDRKKAAFYFRFRAEPNIHAPTEIFVPSQWFAEGLSVFVKTLDTTIEGNSSLRSDYVREEQRLFVYNDGYAGEAEITGFKGRI